MFVGKSFWVAQRVPLRGLRIEQIKQHGGQHVILEKQADVLIWDHIKPDAPPGAVSWTFIEQSVKRERIEDVEDHVCGPSKGTVRDVGSRASARSSREPFTPQDDRVLYKWGIEAERRGISVRGNEIWKQLERVNNRHSWQSWRSRWIKKLCDEEPPKGWEEAPIELPEVLDRVSKVLQARRVEMPERKPPGLSMGIGPPPVKVRETSMPPVAQVDGPLSPPPAPNSAEPMGAGTAGRREESTAMTEEAKPKAVLDVVPQAMPTDKFFTAEDFHEIYDNINDILGVDKVQFLDGWENWAEPTPHTAGEWMDFFRKSVMPVHRAYDHLGAAGQHLVLNWTDAYIKANPRQPFPGWEAIEGAIPASPPNKRPREDEEEEEEEEDEGGQTVPETSSQTISANSGIKRQRVESTKFTSRTVVQKVVEIAEEVSQTIESSSHRRVPSTIDLTILKDTSSSSDFSEEPSSQLGLQTNEDNCGGIGDAELLLAEDEDEEEAVPSLETQAILASETQDVDFRVPEPDDGFADSSDSEEESLEPHDQGFTKRQLQQEGSLDGEEVDMGEDATILGIREPDGGFADTLLREESIDTDAESATSTSTAQSTDEEPFEDLTARLMRDGHSRDNIFTAIVATSGNRALHDTVLDSLRRGKGVPRNIRGIWTGEDDEHLQGSDARMIKRVEEKHGKGGWEGWNNRLKFLDGLNAESEAESDE